MRMSKIEPWRRIQALIIYWMNYPNSLVLLYCSFLLSYIQYDSLSVETTDLTKHQVFVVVDDPYFLPSLLT